jgi:enamine deaminase RidA (YjgF/YER057c/UK114 family)
LEGGLTFVAVAGNSDPARAFLQSLALQIASPGEPDDHPSPQSAHRAFARRPLQSAIGNGLKRVVLAGQVGVKPDGAIAGDLAAQIEQAWDNLLACLASEKLGPEHLVKIVYFTTVNTPEGLKLSREIRAGKLGDIAPSSTFLVIAALAGPDYKVEIEGEAVGPE